jgi:hypothetical protein
MMAECRRYIGSEFLDVLKARCGEILGATDAWSLRVSEQDPNVIQFRYPTAITKNLDYVSPQVVLELGTHAEFVPHDRFTIRSFAAEEFPNVVVDGDVAVVALLAKRTFWEKATILHAEYYRPPTKPIPDRYSRHYYDVAMLAQGPIRSMMCSKPCSLSPLHNCGVRDVRFVPYIAGNQKSDSIEEQDQILNPVSLSPQR